MANSKKMEESLHHIMNSLATVDSSLQFIQKQHPEVRDYLFWNDILADIRTLSSSMYALTDASQTEKSGPAS